MRFNIGKGLTLLALYLITPLSHSAGVSPYLPINVTPILENEVERLVSVSGMSNLTRPYSLARIFENMEKIKDSHPKLYHRLTKALAPYTKARSVTQLSASAKYSNDHHAAPNQRGNFTDTQLNVSFRSQLKVADWLGVFIGGEATQYKDDDLDSEIQATGSIVAIGTDWAQLDIGYKDIWLSPFKGSAQLLSTNAQTLLSVSLSNNLQLDTFGIKWNYSVFLAQLSRQLVQFQPGEFSDEDKPLLAGFHIDFNVTDWWSIGATRTFQFAGGQRPRSLRTLADAFIDPRGADNDAAVDEESGNQIASITSQIDFDGSIPFSFVVELAGEDTSNAKPYELGNTALTAGLYFPYLFNDSVSFTYEYSSFQDQWYANNVYQEGYVNEGFVLGNSAFQAQREQLTATPGSAHFIQSFLQLKNDAIISTVIRFSEFDSTSTVQYTDAWELELDYTTSWYGHTVTKGIYVGKDPLGETFTQFNITWEL